MTAQQHARIWEDSDLEDFDFQNSLCMSKLDYACQIYSSASKSDLEKLEVNNLGLQICTEAFWPLVCKAYCKDLLFALDRGRDLPQTTKIC